MVNETIINYLKSYMAKFPLEKLKSEILSKGYNEIEFDEALNELNKKINSTPQFQNTQVPLAQNISQNNQPTNLQNQPKNQIPPFPLNNQTIDLEKEIKNIKREQTQPIMQPIQSKVNKQNQASQFKKIPTPVEDKKKKIKNPNKKKGKAVGWILLIIFILMIGIVVLNYFNISVFGFNIFRWLNFVPPF